jgi:DNA-binding MarR family transcriptional regulator
MTASGLFERHPDPSDARRVFIALSRHSSAAMAAYFAAVG